jgi:hypothetical protein
MGRTPPECRQKLGCCIRCNHVRIRLTRRMLICFYAHHY